MIKYTFLIVADNLTHDLLRPDSAILARIGKEKPPTPTLDWLRSQGTYFSGNRVASARTIPSVWSMLTGLYPPFHGVRSHSFARDDFSARMPSLLSAAIAAGATPIACGAIPRVLEQMAEGTRALSYKQAAELPGIIEELAGKQQPLFLYSHFYNLHDYGKDVSRIYGLSDYEWVPGANEPFWQRVAEFKRRFCDAEGQIRPDADGNGMHEFRLESYVWALGHFDQVVLKPFVEMLQNLGIWDESLLVLTADHGQRFVQSFDERIRTPLLIVAPSLAVRGNAVSSCVRSIDIAPTIAELAGYPLTFPTNERAYATSLVPWIEGKRNDDLPSFSEYCLADKTRYKQRIAGLTDKAPIHSDSYVWQTYLFDQGHKFIVAGEFKTPEEVRGRLLSVTDEEEFVVLAIHHYLQRDVAVTEIADTVAALSGGSLTRADYLDSLRERIPTRCQMYHPADRADKHDLLGGDTPPATIDVDRFVKLFNEVHKRGMLYRKSHKDIVRFAKEDIYAELRKLGYLKSA